MKSVRWCRGIKKMNLRLSVVPNWSIGFGRLPSSREDWSIYGLGKKSTKSRTGEFRSCLVPFRGGARTPPPPPPHTHTLIFRPNRGPKGPKKIFFWRLPPPPLSKGLEDCPPLSQGPNPPCHLLKISRKGLKLISKVALWKWFTNFLLKDSNCVKRTAFSDVRTLSSRTFSTETTHNVASICFPAGFSGNLTL